ncbi:MAG: hypothetical protein KFH87_06445 [Bacteroidetes bacterium]|nr:hypothetical protein [Bacteroidota bacterium]
MTTRLSGFIFPKQLNIIIVKSGGAMMNSPSKEGCAPIHQVRSWYDLASICPEDPRNLIADATLAATTGELYNSSTFADQTWATTPLSILSTPKVSALGTDDAQKVADAKQWEFSHLTWNDDANLAIPLQKVIFLRGGTDWTNALSIAFEGTPIEEVQISFLNNAATRGDKQGTIPVIRWADGSWSGTVSLTLVLRKYGQYTLGIWTYDGTNYAMYELIIISVP